MESKIKYKSGYFVGEKFFDHRQDAEDYELMEEIIQHINPVIYPGTEAVDIVKLLMERYQIKEKYDYYLKPEDGEEDK